MTKGRDISHPPAAPRMKKTARARRSWPSACSQGKRYRERGSSTINQIRPEKSLKRRLGGIVLGRFTPQRSREIKVDDLVHDLLAWYRTIKLKAAFANAQESKWKHHLELFFGGMPADQVDTDRLRQYRAQRMADAHPPSPTTVNRELQVLRKAYRLGAVARKVDFVPTFEMATEDNARKVFITEFDKQELRKAVARDTARKTARMKGFYLKCFIELLFAYGWRKSELTGLKVKNVQLDRNVIRLETSKSGEGREVALTANLRVVIEPLVLDRNLDDPLFPVKDVRWAWRRLCREAGVKAGWKEGYVIHDTRRTAARTKRAAGVDETVTAAIMGWKPGSKMFARYGIVDIDDTRVAQETQERWEAEQRAKEAASKGGQQSGFPSKPLSPIG